MRGSQKNKNYKIRWSPKFAYAIGLIATDGCLSKDGRHIDFTSQDMQLVETFRDCLNLTGVKIGTKTSGSSKNTCPRIQFSNARLYRWLISIGITPKKSKTIHKVRIPDRYFFDFLRGHFDGDGSSYSYWDKRWKSSFMFYVKFCSASKKHIFWLRGRIKKFSGINGSLNASYRPEKAPLYQLSFAKKESKILIKKMYYKDHLPRLKRKHDKLKRALKINENMEQLRKGRVMESADIYV